MPVLTAAPAVAATIGWFASARQWFVFHKGGGDVGSQNHGDYRQLAQELRRCRQEGQPQSREPFARVVVLSKAGAAVTRTKLDDLKRDRRPMLMLLGSIAAVTITLIVIGYSIPEKTGTTVATPESRQPN
jgi:hypothetical protein